MNERGIHSKENVDTNENEICRLERYLMEKVKKKSRSQNECSQLTRPAVSPTIPEKRERIVLLG